MGNEELDSDPEGTESFKLPDDIYSSIYPVIQILYNLKDFKNYILSQEYSDNSNKKLHKKIKSFLSKGEDYLNLKYYSKKIYKIITQTYKLQIGDDPGKIFIQILEILNYEEKGNKVYIFEDYINQNKNIYNNIFNENQALNDFNMYNNQYNKTKISEFFHGILLTKKKIQNNNSGIMFFFSYYCAYELNLQYIYQELLKQGKYVKDSTNKRTEISLFQCIDEMSKTKNTLFNNQTCLVEYYIQTAPKYFIFVLNRKYKNDFYRDDISFNDECDFSYFILDKKNVYKYKLISMIKKKRIIKNNYDINNNYITIYRDRNDNYFYSVNENNNKQFFNFNEYDKEYYYHLLVFQKINS